MDFFEFKEFTKSAEFTEVFAVGAMLQNE